MPLKLIQTNDGSHSILNEEMNETYHSIHGAINEAYHVFIKHGYDKIESKTKRVFELGFGTGLNVMISILEAIKNKDPLQIYSIETFPLELEILSKINYPQLVKNPLAEEIFSQIHNIPWNEKTEIRSGIFLHKIHNSIFDWKSNINDSVDCIYFDAFAPNKQSDIWDITILQKMNNLLKPNGHLVTYCAQGHFKRSLKSCGFDVLAIEGPPGKKEMTLGIKKQLL